MSRIITRTTNTEQIKSPVKSESAAAIQKQEVNFAASKRIISKRQICCRYTNRSAQFQIIRIPTIAGDFIERTVFPHAQISFKADPLDRLEVHSGSPITAIRSDTIPCYQLIQTRACSLTKISYSQKRLFAGCSQRNLAAS
ncbi:MAG: DUF1830 domain-containing protein [Phormidesmis sp.]